MDERNALLSATPCYVRLTTHASGIHQILFFVIGERERHGERESFFSNISPKKKYNPFSSYSYVSLHTTSLLFFLVNLSRMQSMFSFLLGSHLACLLSGRMTHNMNDNNFLLFFALLPLYRAI